ncbi:bifunctional hemolysin/adenylate cyclase [Roseovarius mucosus]|uniref:Bifunctional hemolysin/adenylate cyclase n=1 Tax=Roseovarius mucosus TaxID=215743 RepID=A0A1V0RTF2_9RHOB|nr:pre-peptidase C-terminal domain-containing protein [Roseovarius mucosus]ARE85057.1 bifunctional hemolysin/adenylate cyclase [Roseovarius mucosus]
MDNFTANAQTTGFLEIGGSVSGSVADGRDWIAVNLEADTAYRFEIDMGLPFVQILSPDEITLMNNTGDPELRSDQDNVFVFSPQQSGRHFISIGATFGTMGGDLDNYVIRANVFQDDVPGDVTTHATLAPNTSVQAQMDFGNDYDWFAVELTAGEAASFELDGITLSDLSVRDANGESLASSDARASNKYVTYIPDESGTFYVSARYAVGYDRYANFFPNPYSVTWVDAILPLTEVGTLGNDTLLGNRDDDFLNGLAGDDRLAGDEGNDTLLGGDGNDRLFGQEGGDEIFGESGDDRLNGSLGHDTLNGGEGHDSLSAGLGDDSLTGDAGNDNIGGGLGNDTIDAGDGDDTVGGGSGNDLITGGLGDDFLSGGWDRDTLDGGDGHDTLTGASGADYLSGGAGDDIVAGASGNDRITGDAGNDRLSGSAGDDRIDGGDGADQIGGGTGRDTIIGGAGDDQVGGGKGDDSIQGGSGNDDLSGGSGADTIEGGDGNDTVNGARGDDVLSGGAGADHFEFTVAKEGETDSVLDFEDGVDLIVIRFMAMDTPEPPTAPSSAAHFETLGIVDTASGVEISFNGQTVIVQDITAAQLTVEDFTFL